MPGDLNLKKSWHPGLVKNQQKLWQQEQDALKEHKRIKERQKEIEEEREKQDLLRLQYGEDLSSLPSEKKLEMNKLGWMYEEGPKKNSSGFTEMNGEFLDGKQKVEDMLSGRQQVSSSKGSRLDKLVSGGKTKSQDEKTISYGKDDPLLKIMGGVRRVVESDRMQGEKRTRDMDRRSKDDRYRDRKDRKESSTSDKSRSRDRSPSRSHRHSSSRSSHSSSHRSHKSSRSSSHRSDSPKPHRSDSSRSHRASEASTTSTAAPKPPKVDY
ncbi:pre-mRNA-splicing factor Cwc25p [[Candida] railenensis]|uniref:Pre-mRNA-splicing factor CWC25 n=1 Tax=[Candida] railenensis TaxID=45579 RepID=A0A9P0QTV4_9ASCO|nr:pre-mRNA-splicing factor Cwc25p [[Candida] railenensis]